MIRFPSIIRQSARRVAQAADETVETLRDRRIEQEPDYTSQIIGRIAHAMDEYEVKGVRWRAKVLTDRGPNAQEKQYGADFVGVLDISLPGYTVKKGFLAQAKMIEPGEPLRGQDWERMRMQCDSMLRLAPAASYLFVYSLAGTTVVPAAAIVASSEPVNPHEFYSRSLSRFFEEHFECFIGDLRIHAASIETLEALREQWFAQRLLYLAATS